MPNSASQRNRPGKPRFHAISHMAKNEGYTVCHLPQYWAQALATIAQLSDPIQVNNFANKPHCRITAHFPSTNDIGTAVGPIEELDK